MNIFSCTSFIGAKPVDDESSNDCEYIFASKTRVYSATEKYLMFITVPLDKKATLMNEKPDLQGEVNQLLAS